MTSLESSLDKECLEEEMFIRNRMESKRPSWGHHPHGLDNPLKIVRFVLQHTLNKE